MNHPHRMATLDRGFRRIEGQNAPSEYGTFQHPGSLGDQLVDGIRQ